MISLSATHATASARADSPATQRKPANATGDRATQRRMVLLGCLALLGALSFGIAARALHVRPAAECQSAPVRLALGSHTGATMTMGAGAACAIALTGIDLTVNELAVLTAPRHGKVAPRGRTGVVYRADSGYRGEDTFDFAVRGRSDGEDGISVVRVQVTVR